MKFSISYDSSTAKIKLSLLDTMLKKIQKWLPVFVPDKQESTKIKIKNKGWIDEIFIGNWFHLESLDRFLWFVSIGEIGFNVHTKIKNKIIIDGELEEIDSELINKLGDYINDNTKYNVRLINNPHGFITDEKGTLEEITIERWFRITTKGNHNWEVSVGDFNFQVNTVENKRSVTKINKNDEGRV
ncbi:MAG: hypothetical protein WCO98_00480 [bacterium]